MNRFYYIAFFFFFSLFIFCTSPSTDKKSSEQYASLSDSTHYVGINTCASCHRDIFETFIQTGMGKSFDVASQQKSAALFSERSIIHDKYKNLSYHPYWNHDSLILNEFRLNGRDTVYSRVERINYIIGSGQHTNSHMIHTNGYIFQAPATFYTQKGLWDLPPGFENGFNSRFSRKIELECMSCHNGFPKMVEGSENKYSFVPNGIDCERCHGPGSKHVEEKRKGNLVDVSKEIDYTIVNPAKLPIDLQLDVCQRCHIQGNAILAEGKSFFDFKPAMHLSEVMNVFMPVYKGQETEHIMASHAERLKMSKCFLVSLQKSDELNRENPSLKPYQHAMTCVTCHNPHVSVKATEELHFNTVCGSCHPSVQSLHPELKMTGGESCVSCHMPKNSTIDIPHVQTTDHYIHVPLKEKEVNRIKEFIGLACINNPKPDPETMGEAYLSYFEKFDHKASYLDSAKKYLDEDRKFIKNFRQLIRWAYLKNDFAQVVRYEQRAGDLSKVLVKKDYSNNDAWTAYRIGESYNNLGDSKLAEKYFGMSVDLAPYIPDFRNKLGTSQITNGKHNEARKNFEFIITENPKIPSAYVNLGYLMLSVFQQVNTADSLYDKALALDPDNEQALINKAGTQVFLNKPAEAKKYLRRVLKVNPSNSKAKYLLNSL